MRSMRKKSVRETQPVSGVMRNTPSIYALT
jgi:hypothetical protein